MGWVLACISRASKIISGVLALNVGKKNQDLKKGVEHGV